MRSKITVMYFDHERPPLPRGMKSAVRAQTPGHRRRQLTHEHGRWWVQCLHCGYLAQVERDGVLEEVEGGDEACR
jgi:hypothetical protein